MASCILCERFSSVENRIENYESNNSTLDCLYCKKFRFELAGVKMLKHITDKQRRILSKRSCVHNLINNEPFSITKEKILGCTEPVPGDALEQLQYMLDKVAELAENLGQYTIPLDSYAWTAILMCDNFEHEAAILNCAREKAWLKEARDGSLSLTVEGWEYLDNKPRRFKSKRAFVAMWFHSALDPICDKGIFPALEKTGYQPDRVDKTNHVDRIDDAIISKIRNSALVIADVTGERNGVYYEAGFAEGLGIPVIWLCNDSWKTMLPKEVYPNSLSRHPRIQKTTWEKRIHFDTRQLPHILWSDPADLKKKLIDRIRARDLDLKLNGLAR